MKSLTPATRRRTAATAPDAGFRWTWSDLGLQRGGGADS